MPHTIRVHAEHARAIAVGHPWVYRQAIVQRPREVQPGDVVELASDTRAFLGRGIYEGDPSIPVRVWTRDAAERIDGSVIATRVRQAIALRHAAGIPSRTEAWRVVNSEGDRMPGVIVERWGEWTSITLQGEGVQARVWAERILSEVAAALPSRGIYFRNDEMAQLVQGAAAPKELWVKEPAGEFAVHLTKPGKPGLFTDMREVRALFAPMLRGGRFLNLFAHTGAFSGAAAAAGASEIVSVDLSKAFLDVADANVARNAAAAVRAGGKAPRHEVIAADVFETLKGLAWEKRRFTAIFVDPPTFSSSKTSGTFNVKDEYRPLIRSCMRLLEPGGLLLAATNYRGVDRESFLRMIHDASELESSDLRILAALGQPADYPSLALVPETRHLEAALCARAPDATS